MKGLRSILVAAAALNLLIVYAWMGLVFSEGILAGTSVLPTSSILGSSSPAQLRFTSNGGILETTIVQKHEKYTTEVIFTEIDSGNPIVDATVRIHGDTGKADTSKTERGNGIYRIEITPRENGRLSFDIEASKEEYSTSAVRLVLSVGLLPSELLFLSNNQAIETGVVEINSTYTTCVEFTSSAVPVNNAHIEVRSFLDLNWSQSVNDQGVYCINISLSEVGQEIYIGIEASANGVATSSVDLILTSTPFRTSLRFISTNSSTEMNQRRVNINETYTTIVQFNRTSTTPETPIDDATLGVVPSDPGVLYTISPLVNGSYQIAVSANQSKQFSIVIMASKPEFSNASAHLTLFVSLIPASLEVINPDFKENELHVTYTDPINVTVRFQDENGPLTWDNYTIDSGGLNFHSLAPGNEFGQYVFHFNASSPETYDVKLNATATGHEAAVLNIMVSADPIPMDYELNIINGEIQGSVIYINESHSAKITLILRESHIPSHPRDNELIKGAYVEYKLEEGVNGTMNEQSDGTYTVELSGEGLDTGKSYHFVIIATEEPDFKRLEIEYSVVINPKPSWFSERTMGIQNWIFALVGIIASFGLLGYIFRRRQQYRKELALFEERIRLCYEFVSDILSFQDLLIISPDAALIYGLKASAVEGEREESLDAAFMMALKTFAGESIMLDELKGEDHFRFGETEIFLVSGDIVTFAFLFEAQMIDDEWKRVSSIMLERCREVVAIVEFEFQEAFQGYQISHDPNLIPTSQLTRRISEILELDMGLPHELTGKKFDIEIYLYDKESILKKVQQLAEVKGVITVTTLLESLAELGVPTDEAVYIFYQLRVGEMIRSKG